jgi:AcrR family transcriptional regulator
MGRPPRISRDQILEAARDAFTARGFAATTLADIAAGLHVTAAAILRHFPSKQDLFAAAMSARGLAVPEFVEELARAKASDDPRIVLRRFAEEFVPFMSTVIRPAIAVQMHMASQTTTLVVPFDTHAEETPPRRGIRIMAGYFRRAMSAGTVRPGDPRAMALLFVGQLQSYVFLHQILDVKPVFPLGDYLDQLFELWTGGALAVETKSVRPTRGGDRARRRGGGGTAVRPKTTAAEAARPRRNARGADGQRRLAGRRTRDPRPRR